MNWSDTVDDEKCRCSDSTLRQDAIALAACVINAAYDTVVHMYKEPVCVGTVICA